MLPHKPKVFHPSLNLHQNEAESSIHANQLQDEGHSFTTAQIKLQNWEYINDYDDSEIVIELSSDGEYASLHSEEDSMSKMGYENENKIKNLVKIEQMQMNYLVNKFNNQGQSEKPRKKRQRKNNKSQREPKINSLKNISFSVCDLVDSWSYVRFPDMMEKFIQENPQYAKNLRRRMYDVINVLSSADVIQKKGLLIKRKDSSANKRFQSLKGERNQRLIIESMRDQIAEKSSRVQQKKKLLQSIIRQKQIRDKTILKCKSPTNEKVMFPLAFYIPSPETLSQIQSKTLQVHKTQINTRPNFCSSHQDYQSFLHQTVYSAMKHNESRPNCVSKQVPIIFIPQNLR